jgi:hypothetical protein
MPKLSLSRLANPDSATMIGVLTAAGVYLIYNNALPTVTDLRTAPAHDTDAESARKAAAWKSAALIGVVFLVARDLNSYIISGAALVGIDYMYKHANGTNPQTGKLDAGGGGDTVAPSLSQAYPLPDYQAAG